MAFSLFSCSSSSFEKSLPFSIDAISRPILLPKKFSRTLAVEVPVAPQRVPLAVVTIKLVWVVLLFFIFFLVSSVSLTLNTESIHDFYQKVNTYPGKLFTTNSQLETFGTERAADFVPNVKRICTLKATVTQRAINTCH